MKRFLQEDAFGQSIIKNIRVTVSYLIFVTRRPLPRFHILISSSRRSPPGFVFQFRTHRNPLWVRISISNSQESSSGFVFQFRTHGNRPLASFFNFELTGITLWLRISISNSRESPSGFVFQFRSHGSLTRGYIMPFRNRGALYIHNADLFSQISNKKAGKSPTACRKSTSSFLV